MNRWVLKVEVDGEWEECTFPTRREAMAVFVALTADYKLNLTRAILFAPEPNRKPITLATDLHQGRHLKVN